MSEVEAKFSCDGCGKTYKWKPDFAGRKVKCKCGFVMTAPAAPPAPPEEDEPDLDALYTLADEGHKAAKAGATTAAIRCPSCRSEVEPGAAVCTQCGFNLKTGKKVAAPKEGVPVGAAVATAGAPAPAAGAFGFPGAKRGLSPEASKAENPVLDLYVPLGLLAFGIFGVFAQHMWFGTTVHNFAGAIPLATIDILFSCIALAMGCMIAIKALDVAFGPPGTAALKVAAIALAPSAIAGFVGHIVGGSTGGWVGWVCAIILYFTLFKYLFDMDMNEVLILSGIMFFVRFVAGIMVGVIMAALFVGGMSGLAAADQASRNDDNWVEEAIDTKPTDEAVGWLNDNTGRMFGDTGHVTSIKLIQDLLAAGCSKAGCLAIKGEGQTTHMWVKLPRDKAKRQEAFDIYNQYAVKYKLQKKTDGGQTYLLMEENLF